jgi:hypothetical protein
MTTSKLAALRERLKEIADTCHVKGMGDLELELQAIMGELSSIEEGGTLGSKLENHHEELFEYLMDNPSVAKSLESMLKVVL